LIYDITKDKIYYIYVNLLYPTHPLDSKIEVLRKKKVVYKNLLRIINYIINSHFNVVKRKTEWQ